MEIALERIRLDPTVQLRFALSEGTVQRYMEMLDDLPAVLVIQTEDGPILVDGFHRVEAARRLARAAIKADVRTGTREDALTLAATANAKHGLSLGQAERLSGVLRLVDLWRPEPYRWREGWSTERVAAEMGMGNYAVKSLIALHRPAGRKVVEGIQPPQANDRQAPSTEEVMAETLEAVPAQYRDELRERVKEEDLSPNEVHVAAEALNDPEVPELVKEAIAEGTIDPVTREGDHYVVHGDTIDRKTKAVLATDSSYLFAGLIKQFGLLTRLSAEEAADQLGTKDRERLCLDDGAPLPALRDYLTAVLDRVAEPVLQSIR